jgi:hypothetical protein
LEGRAPARPQNFSTAVAVPSDFSLNEFGAQKFRHQPQAEASGMEYDLVAQQNNSRYEL